MNRYIKILFLLTVLILPVTAQGQDNVAYKGEIIYREIVVDKQKDVLNLKFQVDISLIELSSQRIIRLRPILKKGDVEQMQLDPIFIMGKIREKVMARNGYDLITKETVGYVIRKNGKEQLIPCDISVPFEDWMYGCDLYFDEKIYGCAACELGDNRYLVAADIVPAQFIPSYELQYVTPKAEEIKVRSESFIAHLNFKVAKYDLLRDFQNNASVLDNVDKTVRNIRSDSNLKVQGMAVTGYASPEGNFNSNLTLSKNRSHAFVKYLIDTHFIPASQIKTDWNGEDWEGLKRSVAGSSLPEKDMVIRIIDNYPDVNARKRQIQSLNGGTTYRILLNEYYPPLRRIEYVFTYIARAFDVEEAKEIIKTKPHHLSLNEMFLVAQTYEKGSKEFNNVFDTAARLFPDDPDANLNTAVQEINLGSIDRAISRLQRLETPEAWNNLGVAYINKGDYELAKQNFTKAANAGNEYGKKNLEQLTLFLESL